MPTAPKTWQQKATAKAIMTKVNRKRGPVSSLVQLAQEFGAPVYEGHFYGTSGRSTAPTFRNHIKNTVGEDVYNRIRQTSQVRS